MELTLGKLPWYGQVGAFVLVASAAVFGFWHFYVADFEADITAREARLAALHLDIAKGEATGRRLPEFEAQVADLQARLDSLRQVLPEEKDVADTLRRIQALATKSNLSIQRFQPGKVVQQSMYAEIPYRVTAEGNYHDLARFLDQVSRFPRIINVSDISIKAKTPAEAGRTITAEYVATTFVLQGAGAAGAAGSGAPVPKQPSLNQ